MSLKKLLSNFAYCTKINIKKGNLLIVCNIGTFNACCEKSLKYFDIREKGVVSLCYISRDVLHIILK